MHGQHIALVWKDVVQYREDTFLDLACVACSTDEDDLLGEVQNSEVLLTRAVNCRVGMEAGSTNDAPLGSEGLQLLCGWAQEQVVGEEVAPRILRDHTDIEAMLRIGTCV